MAKLQQQLKEEHKMRVFHATGIDLEEDANENQQHKETDLRMVQQLAEEMRGLESKMDQLQGEMDRLQMRHQQIQLQALPDLMTQVGMQQFTLVTGEVISVQDFVRASIPSQSAIDRAEGEERAALIFRKTECFAWLRRSHAESLIKTELLAEFGKGQGREAARILREIQRAGFPATLEEVPVEPFALFTGKKANLTRPRAAKNGSSK